MSSFNSKLMSVVRRDPRNMRIEAYRVQLFGALEHTQKILGRAALDEGADPAEPRHHVSCRQLLEGIRSYALQEFGLMARVVFQMWGICRTDDFGEIVFNLIEAELMSKTTNDTRADFHEVFDLDAAARCERVSASCWKRKIRAQGSVRNRIQSCLHPAAYAARLAGANGDRNDVSESSRDRRRRSLYQLARLSLFSRAPAQNGHPIDAAVLDRL